MVELVFSYNQWCRSVDTPATPKLFTISVPCKPSKYPRRSRATSIRTQRDYNMSNRALKRRLGPIGVRHDWRRLSAALAATGRDEPADGPRCRRVTYAAFGPAAAVIASSMSAEVGPSRSGRPPEPADGRG